MRETMEASATAWAPQWPSYCLKQSQVFMLLQEDFFGYFIILDHVETPFLPQSTDQVWERGVSQAGSVPQPYPSLPVLHPSWQGMVMPVDAEGWHQFLPVRDVA